ncbi:MAG TPA: OmpA family protein [Bacteroidales bacterium]|nr:OmpA family protein [Bacteroidales bacterium]
MKTVGVIFIYVMLFFQGFSQQSECPEPEKKAKKLFEQSQDAYNKHNPELAYKLLTEAVREDPNFAKAYIILADVNIQRYNQAQTGNTALQYKNNAINYYCKAADACPSLDNYKACFEAAYYFYIDKKYDKAKPYLDKFVANAKNSPQISEAKNMQKHIDKYFDIINHPVPFNPQKVEGVCGPDDEFLPLISPDDEFMFYTHRINKTNELGTTQKYDVFTKASKEKDKNTFVLNQPMPEPFNQNSNNNQGAVSITIDNNHLYVTICEGPNCDIWVSDNEDGTWSQLRNLGASINGRRSWESQPSISSDGKMLFFASIRPGNIGFELDDPNTQTSDIWMSKQDENGNWLPAKNLGPIINTTGNEKSPFIHSDSKTLYFSSDGHYGVGGYDIYYSKMLPDGKWSEPKNIGYPINTENDEIGFIVSTNGKKAYFSSNKLSDSKGYDIYSFDLYDEARPAEVVFYKGQVKDNEGNPLEDAKVVIKNVTEQRTSEAMVDKLTGKYAVVIPVEKPNDDFLLMVKKKDYAFTSNYIKAEELKKDKPVEVNFEVKPIEEGTLVKINNIYFASNSAIFEKSSLVVLDNFLEFLNENPNVTIEIHGHTDNIGDDNSNLTLSEKRARAVADYLILNGLDPKRIVATKGFGETKPVASNDTETGRALNRRTEFKIVKK